MIPLLTSDEMRAAEETFVERGGNLNALMERAGREVAARIDAGARTLILLGPGNNGGDGLAAARTLTERGQDVSLYSYKREPASEIPSLRTEDDDDLQVLRREVHHSKVLVDGLLGVGRRRPVEGRLAEIISTANEAGSCRRLAIDIPTGVDADTGAVQTLAFKADLTVTLGFAKRGLYGSPGRDYAGKLDIAEIGMSADLSKGSGCRLMTAGDVRPLLPRRSHDWNKGKSGTVLVIAGSYEFSGAPVLTSTAAYRAGAGLVVLAVPERIHGVVASHGAEATFAPIAGSDGWFTQASISSIESALDKADSFAIGPGVGRHPDTVLFVRQILGRLREADLPGVLDADGLNIVAEWDHWWEHVPRHLVITPHPGEMARLMKVGVKDVQNDRFTAAKECAEKWRVVTVLKGSNTIVADPSGLLTVNPTGGPNLGTAGTGDVLTGMIGALLAQGMSARDAASVAVFLHGSAGDYMQQRMGDSGTIASDLWDMIPVVRHRIEQEPGGET